MSRIAASDRNGEEEEEKVAGEDGIMEQWNRRNGTGINRICPNRPGAVGSIAWQSTNSAHLSLGLQEVPLKLAFLHCGFPEILIV